MKKDLGPLLTMYPMPVVLAGTMLETTPKFITVGHVGIMTMDAVSISLSQVHTINKAIEENGVFSLNIPSQDLCREVDYIGMATGDDPEVKSNLFTVSQGELEKAPLIQECPLNMECRLINVVDFNHTQVYVGQVVKTWCEPSMLTDGKVDIGKVRPLFCDLIKRNYWSLGDTVGKCWESGRDLKS